MGERCPHPTFSPLSPLFGAHHHQHHLSRSAQAQVLNGRKMIGCFAADKQISRTTHHSFRDEGALCFGSAHTPTPPLSLPFQHAIFESCNIRTLLGQRRLGSISDAESKPSIVSKKGRCLESMREKLSLHHTHSSLNRPSEAHWVCHQSQGLCFCFVFCR